MKKPTLTLLLIFIALQLDTFYALALNLYGLGREPLLFATLCFALSLFLWRQQGQWQSYAVLLLSCYWLAFKWQDQNGWDYVILPILLITLWLTLIKKLLKRFRYKTKNV